MGSITFRRTEVDRTDKSDRDVGCLPEDKRALEPGDLFRPIQLVAGRATSGTCSCGAGRPDANARSAPNSVLTIMALSSARLPGASSVSCIQFRPLIGSSCIWRVSMFPPSFDCVTSIKGAAEVTVTDSCKADGEIWKLKTACCP